MSWKDDMAERVRKLEAQVAHHVRCAVCKAVGHMEEMQQRHGRWTGRTQEASIKSAETFGMAPKWVHSKCIPGSEYDYRKEKRKT